MRWIFDVLVAIQRFITRAYTYFLLVSDSYPPFEGEWHIRYEVDMPERISRGRLFIWKTVSSIPHFIALAVVSFAVAVVVFIAWFAIIFGGKFPKGLHDFVIGWLRWSSRVTAYWMSLTDEFPAFGFSATESRAQNSTYVISCVAGVLVTAGVIGGVTTLIAWPADTEEVTVAYEDLLDGQAASLVIIDDVAIGLVSADDDYEVEGDLLRPESGERFVLFTLDALNGSSFDVGVFEGNFRLKDTEGDNHRPVLLTVNGVEAPEEIEGDGFAVINALFEIDVSADPAELTYSPSFGFKDRVKYIIQ